MNAMSELVILLVYVYRVSVFACFLPQQEKEIVKGAGKLTLALRAIKTVQVCVCVIQLWTTYHTLAYKYMF